LGWVQTGYMEKTYSASGLKNKQLGGGKLGKRKRQKRSSKGGRVKMNE